MNKNKILKTIEKWLTDAKRKRLEHWGQDELEAYDNGRIHVLEALKIFIESNDD